MKLIIGLGNPGKEYELTRHNVGFLVLDELLKRNQAEDFKLDASKKALISSLSLGKEKIILAKPVTFMNLSGESLQLIKQFYKIETKNILVVYDDKDMDFGKLRFRQQGSSGGHNGIKSLIQHLGTETFDRLKVGVGDLNHPAYKRDAAAFVLGKFSSEEEKKLREEIFFDICEKIEEWAIKSEVES